MDNGGCCSRGDLKTSIVWLSTINMILTGCSIGFTLGYAGTTPNSFYSSFVLIPADVATIYLTCRIVFIINAYTFPTLDSLSELRGNVAGLLAFSLVIFSAWINSIVKLAIYGWAPRVEGLLVNHVCSYVWVTSCVVAGCAAGLGNQITRPLKHLAQVSTQAIPMQQVPMQQVPMQPVLMQQVPVQQGFHTVPSHPGAGTNVTASVPSQPNTGYDNLTMTNESTTPL